MATSTAGSLLRLSPCSEAPAGTIEEARECHAAKARPGDREEQGGGAGTGTGLRERTGSGEGTEAEIERDWRAVLFFEAKEPSAGLQFAPEELRVRLWALKAQALARALGEVLLAEPGFEAGPARQRREAWQAVSGMGQVEAKAQYVALFSSLFPLWREWSRTHGLLQQQQGGGREQLLLSAQQVPKEQQQQQQQQQQQSVSQGAGTGSLSDELVRGFLRRMGQRAKEEAISRL